MLAKSISIIVPTFNRSYTIERCLNSILEQDYPDHKIEIIVVDDGSYDCTPSILTRYQHTNNIRVLRQKNKGVSSARNLGLKHARHSWIAFLDSDDYWMPKKLKYQMNLLTKEQRLVCHTQEIWIRNGKRVNQCKHHQKYGGYTFENNLPLCAMSPSSILFIALFSNLWVISMSIYPRVKITIYGYELPQNSMSVMLANLVFSKPVDMMISYLPNILQWIASGSMLFSS